MRVKQIMTVLSVLAAFQLGCSNLDVATSQAEVDALQKVKSGQYELIKKDELAQLRKDAEIGRSVGRFQIHQEYSRTWRLDTATGAACLLFATDTDWKKPETAAQACSLQ